MGTCCAEGGLSRNEPKPGDEVEFDELGDVGAAGLLVVALTGFAELLVVLPKVL